MRRLHFWLLRTKPLLLRPRRMQRLPLIRGPIQRTNQNPRHRRIAPQEIMEQPRRIHMARQALKPPFAYYGGKTTLAPQIAKLLPEHDHYVEPFAGSLAVLLAKEPSPMETVNDLDGDLMIFWRVLRDNREELAYVCEHTPHSREEYLASCEDISSLPDIERARRVFVRLTQGRSHSMKPTGWKNRVSYTAGSMTDRINKYQSRLKAVSKRLKNVSLESRDAVEVAESYGANPSVCKIGRASC